MQKISFVCYFVFVFLFSFHANTSPNVYIEDTREELSLSSGPSASVGRLKLPSNDWCTATLVGRDLIAAAAHCVMGSHGKFLKGNYIFMPSYSRGSTAASRVTKFWWGSNFPNQQREGDWALGRLDQPLGDNFGWLKLDKYEPSKLVGQHDLKVIGYSGDFKQGQVASWQAGCSFTEFEDSGVLLHNCSTSRGSSGGPILKNNHIVAINVAEYRGNNTRSLIGVPYSNETANIAVPASAFYDLWARLVR